MRAAPLSDAPTGPQATPTRQTAASAEARAGVRSWLMLANASLCLASGLALVLAMSRTPLVMELLPADWEISFRRVLVAHVVFSFLVWCLSALGGLATLAAGARSDGQSINHIGVAIAWGGTLLLAYPTVAGQGQPVISDYVPVLAHPAYDVGLAALFVGVAAPILRLLVFGRPLATPFAFAIAVAGLSMLAAFATVLVVELRLPPGLDTLLHNQLRFWGGGHILQFAYTAMALAAWHALAEAAFAVAPMPAWAFRWTVATLLPCALSGPLLALAVDPMDADHHHLFTELMRWGMAFAPAVIGGSVVRLAWRRRHALGHPAAIALLLSVALFALGGGAGFFSPGGDTRTPGHYHASLSAVNVALMGVIWTLVLPAVPGRAAVGRIARWQLWTFGLGQAAFAAGMFAAGIAGVPRKTAGIAQGLDGTIEATAMAAAGAGGVVAVAAALLFVTAVSLALRRSSGHPE